MRLLRLLAVLGCRKGIPKSDKNKKLGDYRETGEIPKRGAWTYFNDVGRSNS